MHLAGHAARGWPIIDGDYQDVSHDDPSNDVGDGKNPDATRNLPPHDEPR